MGGEAQLHYAIAKWFWISYIDFMLADKSPYIITGERRTKMGNAYSIPNFKDLIETVMYLIMHCSTSTLNDDVPVEKWPKQPPGNYRFLSSIDQHLINDLILNPEFLKL